MKKLLSVFLCLSCINGFAQSGIFTQLEMGAGVTNITTGYPFGIGGVNSLIAVNHTQPIASYQLGFRLGYETRKWVFSSGLSLLKTGFYEDAAAFDYNWGLYPTVNYTATEYYYHLMIPATVGYKFHLGSRLSLIPEVGFEVAGNIKNVYKLGAPDVATTLPLFDFNNTRPFSVWETGRLQLAYKLKSGIDIIAGPQFQYMLAPLYKGWGNEQRNYASTFNIGIVGHKKPKARRATDLTK